MGNKRSVELYYLLQAKLLRGIYGKRISRESDLADTAPPIIHLTSIISLKDDDIMYFSKNFSLENCTGMDSWTLGFHSPLFPLGHSFNIGLYFIRYVGMCKIMMS